MADDRDLSKIYKYVDDLVRDTKREVRDQLGDQKRFGVSSSTEFGKLVDAERNIYNNKENTRTISDYLNNQETLRQKVQGLNEEIKDKISKGHKAGLSKNELIDIAEKERNKIRAMEMASAADSVAFHQEYGQLVPTTAQSHKMAIKSFRSEGRGLSYSQILGSEGKDLKKSYMATDNLLKREQQELAKLLKEDSKMLKEETKHRAVLVRQLEKEVDLRKASVEGASAKFMEGAQHVGGAATAIARSIGSYREFQMRTAETRLAHQEHFTGWWGKGVDAAASLDYMGLAAHSAAMDPEVERFAAGQRRMHQVETGIRGLTGLGLTAASWALNIKAMGIPALAKAGLSAARVGSTFGSVFDLGSELISGGGDAYLRARRTAERERFVRESPQHRLNAMAWDSYTGAATHYLRTGVGMGISTGTRSEEITTTETVPTTFGDKAINVVHRLALRAVGAADRRTFEDIPIPQTKTETTTTHRTQGRIRDFWEYAGHFGGSFGRVMETARGAGVHMAVHDSDRAMEDALKTSIMGGWGGGQQYGNWLTMMSTFSSDPRRAVNRAINYRYSGDPQDPWGTLGTNIAYMNLVGRAGQYGAARGMDIGDYAADFVGSLVGEGVRSPQDIHRVGVGMSAVDQRLTSGDLDLGKIMAAGSLMRGGVDTFATERLLGLDSTALSALRAAAVQGDEAFQRVSRDYRVAVGREVFMPGGASDDLVAAPFRTMAMMVNAPENLRRILGMDGGMSLKEARTELERMWTHDKESYNMLMSMTDSKEGIVDAMAAIRGISRAEVSGELGDILGKHGEEDTGLFGTVARMMGKTGQELAKLVGDQTSPDHLIRTMFENLEGPLSKENYQEFMAALATSADQTLGIMRVGTIYADAITSYRRR